MIDTSMTCAQESRAAQESLAGTFKPADSFFLIECHLADYGGWGGSIVKAASADGEFAPLLRHLSAAPRAKTLFIRRPRSGGKRFFVALTNQSQPRLYATELAEYSDLLSLDLASLAPGQVPRLNGGEMQPIDELYAVCTNGRHDPCCATHGMPVFQELARLAGPERVWQTTHIGGHRLAATMIAFPEGVVYGHLDPEDADAVLTNHRAGCLLTHKYRGRGCYAGHQLDEAAHLAAGAAEAVIRDSNREYALDGIQLAAVDKLDAGQQRLSFRDRAGGLHQALVSSRMSAPRQTSCGDAPKPMPEHHVELLPAT